MLYRFVVQDYMQNLKQEGGYFMKKTSLVDQFPHTSHIETVVLFEK